MFSLLSIYPEVADAIDYFVAMAPIFYLHKTKTVFLRAGKYPILGTEFVKRMRNTGEWKKETDDIVFKHWIIDAHKQAMEFIKGIFWFFGLNDKKSPDKDERKVKSTKRADSFQMLIMKHHIMIYTMYIMIYYLLAFRISSTSFNLQLCLPGISRQTYA